MTPIVLNHTHQLAVNAYLLKENRFLLLKRATPPYIWAPPGGHLEKDEDPEKGLQREVREETGLEIEILAVANTWFGLWRNQPLLAIDYLTAYRAGSVELSTEHSDYRWLTMDELVRGDPVQLTPEIGFSPENFKYAISLFEFLKEDKIPGEREKGKGEDKRLKMKDEG
jgi:8-oxo-dGTP diphosphatase